MKSLSITAQFTDKQTQSFLKELSEEDQVLTKDPSFSLYDPSDQDYVLSDWSSYIWYSSL